MIFRGTARHGWARQGGARLGTATRHLVRQPGQFFRVGLGMARHGLARHGTARQNACRWAVSPDTFGKQQQGNQSKTT